MNLDDLEYFKKNDKLNMLGEIDNLPNQLASAYQLGMQYDLPDWKEVKQVVIAGMGGSAIGADLLASYCAPLAPIPVFVHRDYGLPFFARGAETLVICSSHSGNTEETLDAFEAAHATGCRMIVVSTGGELAKRAKENNSPLWTFEHSGQPRAAVGFSFGLLLAMFQRLGFIPDQTEALENALASMKRSQERIKANVPTVKNPANVTPAN
jgi:glucose/mannose-6-phosphate isomerase